jgi:GSH-dependent disulfide-bond oxidoreductase
MIDLYYWPTPNGWKISIMLEECGLDYRVIPVDIGKGDQFLPHFLKISPNNRMPVIIDHLERAPAISVFESGAILIYLAEKTGRFLPNEMRARIEVLEWLSWQIANFGPMAGQMSHFTNYAPKHLNNEYALDRYKKEYNRCLGVLNNRLADRDYICEEYSIADIATWPWLLPYKAFGESLEELPNLNRWHQNIKLRDAASKGVNVRTDLRRTEPPSAEERSILFGQTSESIIKNKSS